MVKCSIFGTDEKWLHYTKKGNKKWTVIYFAFLKIEPQLSLLVIQINYKHALIHSRSSDLHH